MTDLFDHAEHRARAERLRDEGMSRAVAHAEAKEPGWKERAYTWLENYAKTHQQFISEECTAAAAAAGLRAPATGKEWGHIFKRAAKNKIIRKVGFGISNNRNRSPTPLWESLP